MKTRGAAQKNNNNNNNNMIKNKTTRARTSKQEQALDREEGQHTELGYILACPRDNFVVHGTVLPMGVWGTTFFGLKMLMHIF